MAARCFVVRAIGDDPRSGSLHRSAGALGVPVASIEVADLWFVDVLAGAFDPGSVLDAAIQHGSFDDSIERGPVGAGSWVVEKALLPGVTDPTGEALVHVAATRGATIRAASGVRYRFTGVGDQRDAERLVRRLLANPVIERFAFGAVQPGFAEGSTDVPEVERVHITDLDAEGLVKLSGARGLALDLDQMLAVQRWFAEDRREPTDAELETIAQTWSEHCAHTTFRAAITWTDGRTVVPLMRQLRDCTDAIAAPWVRSAFVGNAGIVAFDDELDLAVKAETHNHPSAVEPFGGANTGVGGVIRDVLGVSARPIAITDVLCFGPSDVAADTLPDGVLHPIRIREGVIAGIADYGNKIGLPTVAGAIVHDPGFTANPLVFAGCVGTRARGRDVVGASPGDRIIALGGRTGRDGIRGATFSSMTMDATTGDVAGASVQIGDPVTERLLIDLIDEAFAADLYSAITDCGAGGFSSAIGEMAEEFGADVDLDGAPRKYPGLAPWEAWLSEAQERMVVAVPPAGVEALAALADAHGVEWCDLGAFRSDGRLVVKAEGQTIVDLPATFLHNGRPQRRLVAAPAPTPVPTAERRLVPDVRAALLALLAHPSIRSNEAVVRSYDHEILGRTVGRPYAGAADDGPADAAVVRPSATSDAGLAIGIGVNVRYGEFDARAMAEAVIDEAIRNVVAAGADPDRICLLDNFSWGDPRRPSTLGQLVDAVEGCCAAATRHGAPFVSGKDSLNNEYLGRDGARHAVPPTLVITAFGVVPDVARRCTPDLACAGDVLVLVGRTRDELRGSHLDAMLGIDGPGSVPQVDEAAPARYRALHSLIRDGLLVCAHDISEGGLAVALAEMAIGGRLGVDIADLTSVHPDETVALFSESSARFVLEVTPQHVGSVLARFPEGEAVVLGIVTERAEVLGIAVDDLVAAWKGHHPVQPPLGGAPTAKPEVHP